MENGNIKNKIENIQLVSKNLFSSEKKKNEERYYRPGTGKTI